MPTWWDDAEGNIGGIAKARCLRTLRGQRPCACMETSYAGTGRSHVCPKPRWQEAALGSLRTHASDERTWEVGQLHTTEEIAEQRLERASGGGGGKGVGQGEPVGVKHAPDPVPGRRDKCARTGTPSGNGSFWRHYLRQEPGAVVPHAGICAGGAGKPASLPRPFFFPFRRSSIGLISAITEWLYSTDQQQWLRGSVSGSVEGIFH